MELNRPVSAVPGSATLGRFAIRAPHDLVALSRRARAAAEGLGLEGRRVGRLAAATYETARLLEASDRLDAEIRLSDHPALEIVFDVLVLDERSRHALRARVGPRMTALSSLVEAVTVAETDAGLSVSLRVELGAAIVASIQPFAAMPSDAGTPSESDESADSLREQLAALQQNYRDLQAELQETNTGVVALYAELQDQADRLRKADERLRRRAEELAAANRAKEDFLATLSHELRTPLNAMLGWTRLLRMGTLDRAASERALETIERNARAQEQLIGDILDLSRVVTGKLRLELKPIELAPVADAALESVRPAADAKGIHLRPDLAAAVTVLGDANRLQQVVWNLLVNAIKFTPAGGDVAVTLGRSGSNALITVSDTGEGISEDLLPFIFDRFTQGDSSATRPHGGLGLGLSIVRHIVELHGGKVQAHSEGKGKGAVFSVHLPVR